MRKYMNVSDYLICAYFSMRSYCLKVSKKSYFVEIKSKIAGGKRKQSIYYCFGGWYLYNCFVKNSENLWLGA